MRFSIITICFNAENEIKTTMESVLNQGFRDMEYVVVDGGSTDSTNEIIESMKEVFEEASIELVHISEKDRGISDAFNKGIRCAKGEIIALINAGDQYTDNALKRVDKMFAADIDILYGNILWKDNASGMDYVRYARKSLATINLEMCVLHPASFIKKRAYNKVGLYNTDYKICMDRDLLARMNAEGCKFKYTNEVFSIMKAGGISDQEKRRKDKLDEGLRVANARGVPNWVYYGFYYLKRAELCCFRFLKKYTPIYKLRVKKTK